MLDLLVYLAIGVIVIVLVWWLLTQIALPEPIGKIVQIVVVVIVAFFLIYVLLQLTGHVGGAAPPLRLH